jgi:hypothetical protein
MGKSFYSIARRSQTDHTPLCLCKFRIHKMYINHVPGRDDKSLLSRQIPRHVEYARFLDRLKTVNALWLRSLAAVGCAAFSTAWPPVKFYTHLMPWRTEMTQLPVRVHKNSLSRLSLLNINALHILLVYRTLPAVQISTSPMGAKERDGRWRFLMCFICLLR